MALYVIADLHLSFGTDKPMDIFGPRWENHTQRLEKSWRDKVGESDTIVIPGDISWAGSAEDAARDFLFISSLPGKKIISKGNHDYWWQTKSKMDKFVSSLGIKNIQFLHNNSYYADGFIICGSRGWVTGEKLSAEDEKICSREAGRLRASLDSGKALKAEHPDAEILCFLHYPPCYAGERCVKICEVLEEYDIRRCYYGHIHTFSPGKLCTNIGSTSLSIIAADALGFVPRLIEPVAQTSIIL